MRKSRFTEAQIIGMIKEQDAGMPTAEGCRRHGLSPATFCKLKARYGGMDLSDAERLKQLCSASTILSVTDNHLGRFLGRRGGVSFDVLVQVAPSFWLSLLVVAGASV